MESEILQIVQQSPGFAYLVIGATLLACGLGLPLPEDITLVAGGYTVYLATQNQLHHPQLLPMIAIGLAGVLSGDIILFLVGRWLGPRATKLWPFRWVVSTKRLERVYQFFSKHGIWTAFFARFAPGLRAPTFLLAGVARMDFRRFLMADGAAALISAPLLVWLAYAFGAQIDTVKRWLANSRYFAMAAVVVVLLIVLRNLLKRRREDAPPTTSGGQHRTAEGGGERVG